MNTTDELAAVLRIRTYGRATILFYLIAIVVAMIYYGTAVAYAFNSTPGLTFITSFALFSLVLFVLLLGIYVYSIMNICSAFAILSKTDRKFEKPLMLINLLWVALVGGAILSVFGLYATSAWSLGIGLFLLILGYLFGVWGIALGLWRFGTRHKNPIVKIGAITAVFSGLLGVILIFLGAGEIKAELTRSRGKKVPDSLLA